MKTSQEPKQSPDFHASRQWQRRQFLKTGAGAAGMALMTPSISARGQGIPLGGQSRTDLAFLVVADTHYLAPVDEPTKADPARNKINRDLIDTLNAITGEEFPANVGGGSAKAPRGVLHLGDLIDSGDKSGDVNEQRQLTEWKVYTEDFGLTGKDGILNYPVYEVHGNHDSVRDVNLAIKGIIERNQNRPGVTNRSPNGLHYSWDWDDIHFVAVGNVVGNNDEGFAIGKYEAFDSLPFLINDLKEKVGNSGRPVVIMHHIDLLRFSEPCDESKTGRIESDWTGCDIQAYYRAVKPYNVIAIFHGHLHGRRIQRWDGSTESVDDGIPVFGSNNSGAGGGYRSFFHCQVENDQLVIREKIARGPDGWTGDDVRWEASWKIPLRGLRGIG